MRCSRCGQIPPNGLLAFNMPNITGWCSACVRETKPAVSQASWVHQPTIVQQANANLQQQAARQNAAARGSTDYQRYQDAQDRQYQAMLSSYESFVCDTAAKFVDTAARVALDELDAAKKRIADLENLYAAACEVGNRLVAEAGALRSELTAVKAENSDLRREVERLTRKVKR